MSPFVPPVNFIRGAGIRVADSGERLAHIIHPASDPSDGVKNCVGGSAIGSEMCLPRGGDAVQFSCSCLLHAAGSGRIAVVVLPPLGGTTLVPIACAGARAQGLLQGLGVRETLVRGLGQTS